MLHEPPTGWLDPSVVDQFSHKVRRLKTVIGHPKEAESITLLNRLYRHVPDVTQVSSRHVAFHDKSARFGARLQYHFVYLRS